MSDLNTANDLASQLVWGCHYGILSRRRFEEAWPACRVLSQSEMSSDLPEIIQFSIS